MSNYNATLQYQDGTTERVYLPVQYPIGTLLSVVKTGANQVVASVVTTEKSGVSYVETYTPSAPRWSVIQYRVSIKKLSGIISGSSFQVFTYNTSPALVISDADISTSFGYIYTQASEIVQGDNPMLWLAASAGFFCEIQSVEYTIDAGSTWSYVVDGNFAAQAWADGWNTGWQQGTISGVEFYFSGGHMLTRNKSRYS